MSAKSTEAPLLTTTPGRRFVAAIRQFGALLVVLVIMIACFSVVQPQFASFDNVMSVFSTSAPLLIVALGLTITLIGGGFDLSLAGVVVLSGIVVAQLSVAGVPDAIAIVVTVILGTAFGAVLNGVSIAVFDLNFFVVTLATLSVSGGLALVSASGETISITSPFLTALGNGSAVGVPFPVIVGIVVFLLMLGLMRYTGFGRMVYAVGGNLEAARLAGMPVTLVRVTTYGLGALLASVAGVLNTATLVSASSDANQNILLTAAAAAFIGGVSFSGGKGTMLGTLLGVVFLSLLQNGLLILAVPVYWQGVITGGILLVSIGLDRFRTRRRSRRITGAESDSGLTDASRASSTTAVPADAALPAATNSIRHPERKERLGS